MRAVTRNSSRPERFWLVGAGYLVPLGAVERRVGPLRLAPRGLVKALAVRHSAMVDPNLPQRPEEVDADANGNAGPVGHWRDTACWLPGCVGVRQLDGD